MLSKGWSLADIWEQIAERFPDLSAQSQDERRYTWAEFDRRADGVARTLLDAGLGHQDKVAQYLYNCPEYLESVFASFKASLVPVNTNYRYKDHEIAYIWEDADVAAVVFHDEFTEVCERLRHRIPAIRCWIWVGPVHATAPEWAVPYKSAAAASRDHVVGPAGRSGEDLFLIYTGGTTGLPKGVMWTQEGTFRYLEALAGRHHPEEGDPVGYAAAIIRSGPRVVPAPPLMHGAGAWTSMSALCRAGSVVTLSPRRYDPGDLAEVMSRERINGVALVGDPFARPLADVLDANPGRWEFSSMRVAISTGAMFTAETKRRLLKHIPQMRIVDALGASETGAIADSASDAAGAAGTASFSLRKGARVIDDHGKDVPPGSGRVGKLAVSGYVPIGYYKDPVKSAQTFITLDGKPHVFTGDWVAMQEDGSIKLLGRGSACINTGGEKVFAEEVEEVLKLHPGVADAVVVGVPDPRLGETVAAVVEPRGTAPSDDELSAFMRRSLAGYKCPRHFIMVNSVGRSPSGKIDYQALKGLAAGRVSRLTA
jgi:acyl-CoA synthetase (AMP-forming)/AMP-acid ligase II